jgi:hypothetical protein
MALSLSLSLSLFSPICGNFSVQRICLQMCYELFCPVGVVDDDDETFRDSLKDQGHAPI